MNNLIFFRKISKNKGLEIQTFFNKEIDAWFLFHVDLKSKCDHAGFSIRIELFKRFYFRFHIYDFRHWDYENKKYI